MADLPSTATDATIELMTSSRLIDGKFALLAVVVLGVAGAVGGWWYQQSLQHRPLKLWGHDAARLFLQAPQVELWRLEPVAKMASLAPDFVAANGDAFRIRERVDVSKARGFLHLRHSLVSDHSFDWSAETSSGPRTWRYALRFSDGDRVATLLVSDDFHDAMLAETGAEASISPVAGGIEDLFNEQLRSEMRDEG
jgi:hypothetical protein